MRSSLGAILGALAVFGGVWIFWPTRSEANTLDGTEDSSAVWGSGKKPPSTVPDAAQGTRPGLWIPGGPGGAPISEETAQQIDSRVTALEPTIRAAARHFSVPTDLLAAVLHRESNGDLTAIGDGGDSEGIGQVQADAADTVNRYWGTDLDRSNWVENIFLAAGYLRYLYNEIDMGWGYDFYAWYNSTRGYLCGRQGAEENSSCAATEASERLSIAGLESKIPE